MRISDWSSDVCSSDLLHPAELGRIEVKLENASDGTLRAVISAERTETLDLLQRDARGLERALQEAGVKTDSGSLSFTLRGQGQHHEQQAGNSGTGRGAPAAARSGHSQAAAAPPQPSRSSHQGARDPPASSLKEPTRPE